MRTKVVLVGGFHEVIELCEECGYDVIGIIDNTLEDDYYNIPIIGKDDDAQELFKRYGKYTLVITPDAPNIRKRLVEYYGAIGYKFATIISPSAKISKSATIGEGTIIQYGVNISSECNIGRFCKLNTLCNVMHDNVIGDFSTIAPNAVLLGRVHVGEGSYIGANSTILPEKNIGNCATIGAGAVVTHDISSKMIVKGVPAR